MASINILLGFHCFSKRFRSSHGVEYDRRSLRSLEAITFEYSIQDTFSLYVSSCMIISPRAYNGFAFLIPMNIPYSGVQTS